MHCHHPRAQVAYSRRRHRRGQPPVTILMKHCPDCLLAFEVVLGRRRR